MASVSPDALAQVAATVVIGIIAFLGTIYGAKLGAKQGADATLKATREAINADHEAAREQRAEEDRAAIRALASECRLNADVLAHQPGFVPDPRMLSPLRYIAFDQAITAIAGLPADEQAAAEAVFKDMIWFNRLVEARRIGIRDKGDTVAQQLSSDMEKLVHDFPARLTTLATQLDKANAQAATNRESSKVKR